LTRQLLELGASVVAVARRCEPLEKLAQAHAAQTSATQVIPLSGDITDSETRVRVIQAAASLRDGAVDLLVNNAGVGAIGTFAQASPERLRRVMDVNFFAPAELTRGMIPLLRNGRAPVICNIGSVLGHCAVPGKSEYCASKFALHGWSDSLRAELADEGIQVTLVSPSTTRSEFFESLIETGASERSASIGSWPPEKVARKTLAAIMSRRREVILSVGGKALVYADRMAPPLVSFLLAKTAKTDREDGAT
jgi:short-subunit dehydrogenase